MCSTGLIHSASWLTAKPCGITVVTGLQSASHGTRNGNGHSSCRFSFVNAKNSSDTYRFRLGAIDSLRLFYNITCLNAHYAGSYSFCGCVYSFCNILSWYFMIVEVALTQCIRSSISFCLSSVHYLFIICQSPYIIICQSPVIICQSSVLFCQSSVLFCQSSIQ